MAEKAKARLKKRVRERRALVVVGSGVTFGATGGAPTARWDGLLEDGIAWCEKWAPNLPPTWGANLRGLLEQGRQGHVDSLLLVAEALTRVLEKPPGSGGAQEDHRDLPLRQWLRSSIGPFQLAELPPEGRLALDALVRLPCPLVTTNYDDLLRQAAKRPVLTWIEREAANRALRLLEDPEAGVLHLHGHWEDPGSVVLGIRSYEALRRHASFQAFERAAAATRSFVFVGCGGTVRDPNLGALLDWLARHASRGEHFLVAVDDDLTDHAERPSLYRRHFGSVVEPVSCGATWDELPGFLDGLAPPSEPRVVVSARAEPPPALAAYRAWAEAQHATLRMVGVGAGNLELPLDEVYVPLRLAAGGHAMLRDLAPEGLGKADHPDAPDEEIRAMGREDLPLEEILRAAARQGARHAVILGDPGTGKTTALRKLHRACFVPGEGPGGLGLADGSLPVFLRLRSVQPADLAEGLRRVVAREAESEDRTLAGCGPALWRHGRVLLLLDGLDEIPTAGHRLAVCRWLERELADAPEGVRAVVSTRRSGWDGLPSESDPRPVGERVVLDPELFQGFDLRPLDPERIAALARRWFDAAITADPRAEGGLGEARDRLLEALAASTYAGHRWREMVSNPLLLTLLCVVSHRGKVLPRQRTEFYHECLEVLLGSWVEREHDERPPLPPAEALELLRPVAWELQVGDGGARGRPAAVSARKEVHENEIRESDLVAHLQRGLRRLGRDLDPYDLADWLRDRAGVLTRFAPHWLGFFHLGVQEYLAALHAAAEGEELLERVAEAALDPEVGERWDQVVQLAGGLPHRRAAFAPLARGLVARGALLSRPRLLEELLDEAFEVDVGPFLPKLEPDAGVDEAEMAAALRLLLRAPRDERLLAAAEALHRRPGDVGALARQLLENARRAARGAEGASGPLLLVVGRGAEKVGEALAVRLEARGRGVVAVPIEGWEERQREIRRAGALAFLAGPGAAPWLEPGLPGLVEIARGRELPVAALLLGRTEPTRWPEAIDPPVVVALPPRLGDRGARTERALVEIEAFLGGEAPGVTAGAEMARGDGAPRSAGGEPRPGEAFTEPVTGIRFLWVPGGRFQMGAEGISDEELPVHPVRLTPFWLAETPVTNAQYRRFLEAAAGDDRPKEPEYWRDRRFSDDDQPVVGVSWHEARAFCAWLERASGLAATLPSEARWEFAARGEEGRPYPWGREPPSERRARYGQEYGTGRPAPVGSFPEGAAPFGHLDLAGNVWEWCLDAWDAGTYGKRRGGGEIVDPVVQEGEADFRGLRGGGWGDPAGFLRSAVRFRRRAGYRGGYVGFRVAVAPPRR